MKIFNISLLIAGIGIVSGSIFYAISSQKKIGVIKLSYVFENFEGSKSAAEELLNSSEKYQNSIDSLSNRLALLSLEKEHEKEAANLERLIYEFGQKAEYNYGELNGKLSRGVQNQIDTYLEIYRKENGYDVLISQYQSTGAIAVSEDLDISKQFTKALNDYYFYE